MKVGDVVELAVWLSGRETMDQYLRFAQDCKQAVLTGAYENNVTCAPIVWSIKYPGEERVPAVPDNISGPNVRLLIAEAEVVKAGFVILPEYNQQDLPVH